MKRFHTHVGVKKVGERIQSITPKAVVAEQS